MANRSAKRVTKTETAALARDNAETYNRFKEFEGHRYTGMKIGRGHKWYYVEREHKSTKKKCSASSQANRR